MSVEEMYINERLDHLGIVAGVSQEIGSESHASALAVLMPQSPLPIRGKLLPEIADRTKQFECTHKCIEWGFEVQTTNLQQILSEMDLALADEINSQQTKKTAKRIAVDGKPISEQSNQYLYTFSLEEPWEPQDETPLTIRIPGDTLKATLVNSRGMVITIATEKQLPANTLQRVELFDDSTRLLENLRKAINNADEGTSQLGSRSFGLLQFIKNRKVSPVTFGSFEPDPTRYATRWCNEDW